jgi:hypothetical protein
MQRSRFEMKVPRRRVRAPGLADWLEPTCPSLDPALAAALRPVNQVSVRIAGTARMQLRGSGTPKSPKLRQNRFPVSGVESRHEPARTRPTVDRAASWSAPSFWSVAELLVGRAPGVKLRLGRSRTAGASAVGTTGACNDSMESRSMNSSGCWPISSIGAPSVAIRSIGGAGTSITIMAPTVSVASSAIPATGGSASSAMTQICFAQRFDTWGDSSGGGP